MPTDESHLRYVKADTSVCDHSVGEMFFNFMLEPKLRLYAGVDLSKVLVDKKLKKLLACWERILTGFSPSPYFVANDILVIEEVIRGSSFDKHNIFR